MKRAFCLSILCFGACRGALAAHVPQPKFAARRDYPSAGGYVSVADINGDGIPDVISIYQTYIATLLGNGDSAFREGPYSLPGGDQDLYAQIQIDLNADGKLDLILSADSGMGVCFGNGTALFSRRYITGRPAAASATWYSGTSTATAYRM